MSDPLNTGDTGDQGTGESFLDSIQDEGLRGHELLKDVESLDSLAKDFVELKSSQPKTPETPDDYHLEAEEGQIDPSALKQFREVAHKAGLSSEAFEAVVKFDIERSKAAMEAAEAVEKEEYAEVQKELGAEKSSMAVAKGKQILKAAGLTDLESVMDSSPGMLKLMAWVGSKISEDSLNLEGSPAKESTDKRKRTKDGRPMLSYDGM